MIIFLYGQDTYRSRQKLNEIVEHYKKIHKSGLNLRYFDFEKDNFQEFQDEIKSTSMFKEKKLIVLKNTFPNESFKANFLKSSKKFVDSPDIFLFYETKEVPEDELFKFLKKYAKSQEFKLLEGESLKNWVKKEFENYQAKIAPEALKVFLDFVGNNLWRASNEIKKLVSYKNGFASGKASAGKQKIEVKDVKLLVRPKIETDIFKTIDVLASKNKKQALELIHQHLEKGDSPLYLLAMINFQFRNLLMIKSHELGRKLYANDMQIFSKRLKMHPYVIRKTMQQTRKFTFEELKKIYQKIFETDIDIKTGKIEPETALDLLVARI